MKLLALVKLEIVSLGEIWHMFAASIGMLQLFPLILRNSDFPFTTAIFLNQIFLDIRNFSKSFKVSGIGYKAIYCRLLDMNFPFVKVLITCLTSVQFFSKGFHRMMQLWSENLIFFMFKKCVTALIQASMAYCENVIGALLCILKKILNLTTCCFLFLTFLITIFIFFNPLVPGGNKKVTHTYFV